MHPKSRRKVDLWPFDQKFDTITIEAPYFYLLLKYQVRRLYIENVYS